MGPPQRVASRPSSRNSQLGDHADRQQFGRSATSLVAEAASASFRDIHDSSRSPASSRPITPLNKRKHSLMTESKHDNQLIPALPPPPRLPSYTPAVSSPLNASPPETSSESQDGSSGSIEGESKGETLVADLPRSQSSKDIAIASSTPNNTTRPTPRRGRRRYSEMGESSRQRSSRNVRSPPPMTLSDLGRDYSRYPFRDGEPSYSAASSPAPYGRFGTSAGERLSGTATPKNPFDDSSTNLLYIEDTEKSFSPFIDDRIGAPYTPSHGFNFPMDVNEKEPDDDMHMPHPDDDLLLKPTLKDYIVRGHVCSLFGALFLLLGLSFVFVVFPVLSFTGTNLIGYPGETPIQEFGGGSAENPKSWAFVNGRDYPLLQNIRKGLIDSDTPESAMTRTAIDGTELQLVFSDEFNTQNRTFYPGDDPFWTAPDLWYGATQDLEWYDPDAATTYGGTLLFQLDKFPNHGLNYRSGMLNSWNQICFKGGSLEVSISLAGPGGVPGLWPGAWTMGNLGRPGYKATTEGVWPYTYDSCDIGITPNQSAYDGMSMLPGQKLPSCTCPGSDHPTPGTGRGAPEIDVIEASADPVQRVGVVTQSYQVAPFDVWYHPNYDFLAIPNNATTEMNSYCGGPFQQAISGTTWLNNSWYDGVEYQKYAYEYSPGTGSSAYIAWYVGNAISYMMNGNSIGPNGNVQTRIVSEEPMHIVLNLGFSTAWTQIDYPNLKFPTTMHIDYVRWYQRPGEFSVTCDPEGYETTEYIANHPKAYNNYNLTSWDETGYGWPKHSLNGNC